MLKALVVALVMISCTAGVADVDYCTVDPVVEARGIWIDAGAIPKTARGIKEMVRSYARAHYNVLLPETICRGYAIYPSSCIERDPRFAGAIDPLPVMISEAHRLGIEVHPWVWVFRVGYTKDKGAILRSHPDWAELGADGKDLSPNGGYWLSPAVPAAKNFLASLFAELVSKYNVDGLHLDYIRYETEEKGSYGYSQTSREQFTREYGVDPINVKPGTVDQLFWNKFRERQVNTFVQRIALQTRAIRPRAIVSAAVAPYPPDARLQLMQNWPNWVANKWVDYVTPMSYSTDDGYFGRLIFRQKEAVGDETVLAEGLGIMVHKDTAQTIRQIGESRRRGALGQVTFAASYVKNDLLNALACGPYSHPALLPFRGQASANQKLILCSVVAQGHGVGELADYYNSTISRLNDYYTYRATPIPYIPPTAPSIAISR